MSRILVTISNKIYILFFWGLLVSLLSLACGGGDNPPSNPTPLQKVTLSIMDTYWYVGALGSCSKMAKSGKTIKSGVFAAGTGK